MVSTPQQLGSDAFDDGFGGGGFSGNLSGGGGIGGIHRFLVINEETLQGIADITGGAYYRADDAD